MATRFLRQRSYASAGFALGGVTFGGVPATIGCFFFGCCGSPMLAVYLSLFGAAFLPFAKPLVAATTTLLLIGAWWWVVHLDRKKSAACCLKDNCFGR